MGGSNEKMVDQSNDIYHDDHLFGIKSNDSAFVLINDSGWIPGRQENFIVHNVGRTEVQAELWYGTQVQWIGIVEQLTVPPERKKILNNEDKIYYVTGLKVINNGKQRAIVRGEKGYVYSPYKPNTEFDLFNILAQTFALCAKFFVSSGVSNFFRELFLVFWPQHKSNVWEQISDKVHQLLDENTKQILKAILENEVAVYREKIESLDYEWGEEMDISVHYMSLAYELIGLERKFHFSSTIKNHENINILLLPMYSCVVALKINFYLIGMRFAKDIGLNKENVRQIQLYANTTFQNASEHIKIIAKNAVDNVYENSEVQTIFNNMMIMRTHLSLHGAEYLPIWEYQLENPSSDKDIYNPVISFSKFFGKPTPNLYRLATAKDVPPPLCPKMINGKRDVLRSVEIYLRASKIAGAKLTFESRVEYKMGTVTYDCKILHLNGAKIIRISAFGEGKIDGLIFMLSSGLTCGFGETESVPSVSFSLEDHHIPSFYLSSDCDELNGQAANFAVAFQWSKKKEQISKRNIFGTILRFLFRR